MQEKPKIKVSPNDLSAEIKEEPLLKQEPALLKTENFAKQTEESKLLGEKRYKQANYASENAHSNERLSHEIDPS